MLMYQPPDQLFFITAWCISLYALQLYLDIDIAVLPRATAPVAGQAEDMKDWSGSLRA
jgi:hypothetical protein